MANLKLDLINKYNNEKMFAELELVRLAQEPNMNYKSKIALMDEQLTDLLALDGKIAKVEQYFQEPQAGQAPPPQAGQAPPPQADAVAPAEAQPVAEKPAGKVHQGQSHGEG